MIMQQQIFEQQMLGRRGFIGLAGMGALAAFIPQPLWALANAKYPTLQAKIDSYITEKKAAGIVAAIGRDLAAPEVLSAGTLAFGTATPVDIDSLFRVYSMTKPITGMAAMILIGEGKLKLDQPISDFLPEFKNMTVLVDGTKSLDAVPAKNAITIRHLLTHTAGLGYSIITKGPLLKAYMDNGITPGVVSRFPIPGFESGAPVPDLKTFAERVAKLPLIAEPGTKWSYSIGLDLMGRVIEVVSGMDFEAFLKARLFAPLKMNSSFFQVPASEIPRFTTNYGIAGGTLLPIDPAAGSIYLDKPAFAFGGAGLVTSTRDYDQFLKMLLGGGMIDGVRIMAPATAALGMSNLLPAGIDMAGTFAEGAGFGAGGRVGLGDQAGSFGWGGAAGTNAFVDTKRKFRAIGMVQYMPANVQDFQNAFPRWVYADLAGASAQPMAAKPAPTPMRKGKRKKK
jgi:CubicO group peptidase (beta-lactamase class C family)